GLLETMETLEEAEIPYGGAGRNLQRASQPVILNMGENRVIMVCYGSETSGIPASWEATGERSGLNLIRAPNKKHIAGIAKQILSLKQKGDIVVFSIHWGSNWGYHIPERQKEFARLLIDEAGVDLVHGHSSHHPIGIEVYQDKLILYGAGDFINDYEGISGYENYRDDLSLMYFPVIDPEDGKLLDMRLYPMQIKNIKLNRASEADAKWLMERLNKEGMKLGTKFILEQDKSISMAWY
ncbi:MAG: CapA family protein, partial [Bacteroidales bacterium]|nr:CapA family protein [Bacteroidales bacterium]